MSFLWNPDGRRHSFVADEVTSRSPGAGHSLRRALQGRKRHSFVADEVTSRSPGAGHSLPRALQGRKRHSFVADEVTSRSPGAGHSLPRALQGRKRHCFVADEVTSRSPEAGHSLPRALQGRKRHSFVADEVTSRSPEAGHSLPSCATRPEAPLLCSRRGDESFPGGRALLRRRLAARQRSPTETNSLRQFWLNPPSRELAKLECILVPRRCSSVSDENPS